MNAVKKPVEIKKCYLILILQVTCLPKDRTHIQTQTCCTPVQPLVATAMTSDEKRSKSASVEDEVRVKGADGLKNSEGKEEKNAIKPRVADFRLKQLDMGGY